MLIPTEGLFSQLAIQAYDRATAVPGFYRTEAILAIQVDALLILSKGRAILVADVAASVGRTTVTAILFADAKPFERAVAVTPAAVITY